MFEVTVSGSFEASHFINADGASDSYRRVHGHSFVVSATCAADQPNKEGWVIDLGVFGTALNEVLEVLDHSLLNEIEGLEQPTFENILIWIDNRLAQRGIECASIEIQRPTINQRAIYKPKRS